MTLLCCGFVGAIIILDFKNILNYSELILDFIFPIEILFGIILILTAIICNPTEVSKSSKDTNITLFISLL